MQPLFKATRHTVQLRVTERDGFTPIRTHIIKDELGQLNMKRPPNRHFLKVVCGKCNNGWMSRLQKANKNLLLSLIRNKWPIIGQKEQELLAAWATI